MGATTDAGLTTTQGDETVTHDNTTPTDPTPAAEPQGFDFAREVRALAARCGVDLDRVLRTTPQPLPCVLEGATIEAVSTGAHVELRGAERVRDCARCYGHACEAPQDGGPTRPCPGHPVAEAARLVARARVPGRYATALDDPSTQTDATAPYLADDWRPGAQGLWLHGDVGRGKSYALATIALHLAARRLMPVRWWSMPQLLGRVQESYSTQEGETQAIASIAAERVLVVDEVGTRFGNVKRRAYELQILADLVEMRSAMGGTATMLISSNYAPQEMERIGADEEERRTLRRTVSRLVELCRPVALAGFDQRRMGAQGGVR